MKDEMTALVMEMDRIDGGISVLTGVRKTVAHLLAERVEECKTACGFDSAPQAIKAFWRNLESDISLSDEALILLKLHETSSSLQDFVALVANNDGSLEKALKRLQIKATPAEEMSKASLN